MARRVKLKAIENALRPLRIGGEENARIISWRAPAIHLSWWLLLSFIAFALLSTVGVRVENGWLGWPLLAAGMTLLGQFGHVSQGSAARHRRSAAAVSVTAFAVVLYGLIEWIGKPAHTHSGPADAAAGILGSLVAAYAFAAITHLPSRRADGAPQDAGQTPEATEAEQMRSSHQLDLGAPVVDDVAEASGAYQGFEISK
jgi:hypothetical protein